MTDIDGHAAWWSRSALRLAGPAAIALLLVAVTACGGNASSKTAGSPATAAPATAAATSAATASGTVTTAPSPNAGAQTLTEVATDNQYSQTQFTAKAGIPIALTLTNKGSAIHDWHLLDAKDVDGRDIMTRLLQPGESETVAFTIKTPGTYHFQCDVHPQDMKGTLTIS